MISSLANLQEVNKNKLKTNTGIKKKVANNTNDVAKINKDIKRMRKLMNSRLHVNLSDPIVEYNIDAISYDLQSLVGEIGGTLGLTIGLSFLSFSEYLIQFMKYLTSNM